MSRRPQRGVREVAEYVSIRTGASVRTVAKILNVYNKAVVTSLREGFSVRLCSLGTMTTKIFQEKPVRDLVNGIPMTLPERVAPVFRPDPSLVHVLNPHLKKALAKQRENLR